MVSVAVCLLRKHESLQWFQYDEVDNTLQNAADMVGSASIVEGFWNDVGRHKRDMKQYSADRLQTLRIYSSKAWRGEFLDLF